LPVDKVLAKARSAKAIVCVSGTHWGEPSSVLSEFLDNAHAHRHRSVFKGKPAGVIVSQQSVNGYFVEQSIQRSLKQLGASVSQNRSMVISQINEARSGRREASDEVASLKTIPFLARNLMRAISDHYPQEIELLARHGKYDGAVWVPAP
jgi:multimeric flavodoxin WrbA